MITTRSTRNALAAACALIAVQATSTAHAVDSASLEFGTGNHTKMARLGMQWKWDKKWWESNGLQVGGYWDLTLAQWRGNRFQNVKDKTQNLTDIGITPVFRLQRDTLTGPYGEFGIGANYLTDLYDNNGRKLSTRFEFGDLIGFGYVFSNKLDLGIRLEHFSNGGIKHPNNGVNFAIARVQYQF